MMAVALTLRKLGAIDRDLYLLDTYTGMTPEGEHDLDYTGQRAVACAGEGAISVGEVRGALALTGYPLERMRFVVGPVEETLPARGPATVCLMRLDTDWYESTRHELVHLYPRLSIGGVLLIDDYGHMRGARRAVDEYFQDRMVLLNRIDYSGRIAIKLVD